MATFNLLRNSRVLFTTNVNTATGAILTSGFLPANTQEIQILDGFSFSQASNADTVTISEAGNTPVRGQRSFNTSIGNVEFSFSTYVRPNWSSPLVKAEESCLWNALLCNVAIGSNAATAFTATGATTASITISAGGLLTIPGTGMVVTNISPGDYVVITGVTGVGASQFNSAVKILTATATSITAQYVNAPTAVFVAGGWTAANVKFSKCAWNENTAVPADLVATPGIITAYSSITSALSNRNQLLKFGMVITVDGITYLIDDCAMDQAVIDFGLDGIATIAWTGKGRILRTADFNVSYSTAANPVLTGMITSEANALGTAAGKVLTAPFITNKLSTVTLVSNVAGVSGTPYTLALTGGSLTIANGITYVTPANLGVVNAPIGYFTGTRAISGSMTAYLRTGSGSTSALLTALLAAGSEPKYKLQIEVGGAAAGTRIELECRGAVLQIPTIDAQAVMSTSISFTAQGTDAQATATSGYDIENTNDLAIRYFAV